MPEQMPDQDEETAGAIEECLDEIDEFIGTLQRFTDRVIAESMRVHLASLLRSMIENNQYTGADVHEFVSALEQDAIELGDEDGEEVGRR